MIFLDKKGTKIWEMWLVDDLERKQAIGQNFYFEETTH